MGEKSKFIDLLWDGSYVNYYTTSSVMREHLMLRTDSLLLLICHKQI